MDRLALLDRMPTTSNNICISCGATTVDTIDSRMGDSGWRKRRKRCKTCKHRWTTYEIPVDQLSNLISILTKLRDATLHIAEVNRLLQSFNGFNFTVEEDDTKYIHESDVAHFIKGISNG